jgi:hypothetical protein
MTVLKSAERGALVSKAGRVGPEVMGGTIDIKVNSFSVFITLSAKGGAGGKGGKGQDGGKGGRGGNGEGCELGRHGRNGGSGGNGGVGGLRCQSGNGGVIVVRTKNIADGNQASIKISAGAGRQGGDPGAPGLPVPPGDDGSTTDVFSTSSDCANMGPVPQWGSPGMNPSPASLGNGQNGSPGKEQFL